MSKLSSKTSTVDQARHDAAGLAVLTKVRHGAYDPSRTPAAIAAEYRLREDEVRRIVFGLLARREITWGNDPRTGISRMVLTGTGKERLARSGETC